jgi:hypothetical protein
VGKPEGKRPQKNGIDLAQDRDKWRGILNVVMYLRAP